MSNKPDITKAWADFGTMVEPNDAKKDQGWVAEKPPFQTFNWWQNRVDHFQQHVNVEGIPIWDSITIYVTNSIVKGSDGETYKALSANTNVDPIADILGNWRIVRTSFTGAHVENLNQQSVASSGGQFTVLVFDDIVTSTPSSIANPAFITRLTAPFGAKFVKIESRIRFFENANGIRQMSFSKNGGAIGAEKGLETGIQDSQQIATTASMSISSPPIRANEGDYFEVLFSQNSGSAINIIAGSSWFSMEVLE